MKEKRHLTLKTMAKNIKQMNIPVAQIKRFVVTGIEYCNHRKRFKLTYNSFEQAMMINLWNGSVWAELDNGKRKLLKRVVN
jgi:hypothetical protein